MKKLYECGVCRVAYESKKMAEKCEEYCGNKHACNIEIIGHRIKEK